MNKMKVLPKALLMGLLLAGYGMMTACSDDNDNPSGTTDVQGGGSAVELDAAANIDYTAANAASWRNYMLNVAKLLQKDANTLAESWQTSYDGGAPYAETFKRHNGGDYTSASDCVFTIIDKCVEITDEVGNTKIGDPYTKWMAGRHTEALYAVESWYSFRSREDYSNNIKSIRNSYYGSTDNQTISPASLYALMNRVDADLNQKVVQGINEAERTILDIPQPFRNNIGHATVPVAQTACIALGELLDKQVRPALQTAIQQGKITEAQLDEVVATYTDQVIVPTYARLRANAVLLTAAIQTFYNNPTNEAFETACEAWKTAREPWEKSEAFLFGPVDALGLDPNMDSWPLDQVAIVSILNSGNFDNLDWTDGDDEDRIAATQEVRGFHTLEFLLFKNGEPRKVNN